MSGRATWDGSGTNSIELFQESRFPHSLGLYYSAFTAWLGFEVNDGEYKVMGMAPYGRPNMQEKVRKVINFADDGSFWLDMDYFSFHHSMEHTFSRKFETLFGEPRKRESDFFTHETGVPDGASKAAIESNQYYADVAASVQRTTEEAIINIANYLHKRTGSKRLRMAGGVAYNSVANGRILRETGFEELYIQPSAGDSGGALGAALYAYHVVLGKPRKFVMDHAYWGQEYGDGEVKSALEQRGVGYEYVGDEDKLAEICAGELASGRVLGWSRAGSRGAARPRQPQHHRRPSPRRDEGRRQHQDQVPRAVPAVRPSILASTSMATSTARTTASWPKSSPSSCWRSCRSPRTSRRRSRPSATSGTGRLQAVHPTPTRATTS